MGYAIFTYAPIENSKNNGFSNTSFYAAGLDFQYSEEIDNAYKDALDIAGKIVDNKERQEAELRIKNAWETHKKIVQKVQANKDTVRTEVTAEPDGSFVNRIPGWISVDTYLGTALANQQEPVVFKNTETTKQYVVWRVVDRQTKCGNAQNVPVSPIAVLGPIEPNGQVSLPIDASLSACYSFSRVIPNRPNFSEGCRVRVGQIASSTPACTLKP